MQQKIWVYALNSDISPNQSDKISEDIQGFLQTWDAHGAPVKGRMDILGKRILAISLSSEEVIPSGCSKDKLDKSVRTICAKHGIQILDESDIVLKKDDCSFEVLKRNEFKQLLNSGALETDTLLLDYSCLGNQDTNLNNIFRPIETTWAISLKNQ